MRNLNYFALMSAALLTGAVAFTSCSSDDEVAGDGGATSGAGSVVKTSFALNIPYNVGTRMTADNTQQNGQDFLGMNHVRLLSFTGVPGTGTSASQSIPLGDIDASGTNSLENGHKIYNDVNITVGTNNFLFYATAPMGTTEADMFTNGFLDDSKLTAGNTGADDITFSLKAVKTSDDEKYADSLLTVLNAIDGVDNWASGGTNVNTDLRALHTEFVKLKAGSANSIKLALQNLYNTVEVWATGTGNDENATIAKGIRAAIVTDGTFTVVGSAAPYTLTTTNTYPRNINLPDGAVELVYTSDATEGSRFAYSTDNNGSIQFNSNKINNQNICYPPSLYYFVNTDLAASDADGITWPTSAADWVGTSAPWTSGWDNAVEASTRTIALKKNVQYAVANLITKVKCGAEFLPQNTSAGEPASTVTVPTDGFKVTGMLIGGQPEKVDWKLQPANANMTKIVYDKFAEADYLSATASDPVKSNYTLLLSDTLATVQDVYFALELENNSATEFRGADGIVPVDGKFYLVGKIDGDAPKQGTTPTGMTNPHAFMADYTTTANVTITSLAKAYNTIPDLRATKMELGLSVELTWKTGVTYDVTVGE